MCLVWCRYMPILPLVLINGAEGIGTGWSTSIPNYNPRDLVDNMKRLLNGEELVEMQPWYRGFSGAIMEVPSKTAGKSYTLNGVVSQVCHLLWHRLHIKPAVQDDVLDHKGGHASIRLVSVTPVHDK